MSMSMRLEFLYGSYHDKTDQIPTSNVIQKEIY